MSKIESTGLPGLAGAHESVAVAGLSHAGAGIVVPDAHLLFNADFTRHGNDLVLTGEHGERFVVVDYFLTDRHPDLLSPTGAVLSADLVDRLAGHQAAGQYAQAGQTPAAAADAIGRVEAASGEATVIRNGVTITLNVGDPVLKGDIVQTGRASSLALALLDGTAFNLTSSARMALNELVYSDGGSDNQAVFSLVQGSISFLAGKIAKSGDMRVDTPVTTMGIRGTAVLVDILSNDGASRFSVMVEQSGVVGSYVLLNKTTGAVLATVNQADTVVYVTPTGSGQVSIQTATKSPQDLQQESALVAFLTPLAVPPQINPGDQQPGGPNINPRAGKGGGSGGLFTEDNNGGDSGDGSGAGQGTGILMEHKITDPIVISIEYGIREEKLQPLIPLSVLPFNDQQTLTSQITTVTIQLQVISPTTDVVIPFVPDTAVITSVTGPAQIPPGVNLADLVTLNPNTGTVTYDNSKFAFLGAGEQVVYTVQFTALVNGKVMVETLPITIAGINDVPEVSSPAVSVTIDAATAAVVGAAAAGSAGPAEAKAEATGSFTFKDLDFADTHKVVVVSKAGDLGTISAALTDTAGSAEGKVTWTYEVSQSALKALGGGEVQVDTFTFTVLDNHGGAVTETVSVELRGQNDIPTIHVADVSDQFVFGVEHDRKSFSLLTQTTITDPDTHDVKVPYVAGSASVHVASAPDCAPADLASLVSVDKATGEVSYDPDAFSFLRPGQVVDYAITFNASSGPDTRSETLHLTINGPDYVPAIAPALAVSEPKASSVPGSGSALSTVLDLHAGDVVTFSWIYADGAVHAFGDYAFAGLGGHLQLLGVPQLVTADSKPAWNTATFIAQTDGPATLAIGQLNTQDSHLYVDNVSINGTLVDGFDATGLAGWTTSGDIRLTDARIDQTGGSEDVPVGLPEGNTVALVEAFGVSTGTLDASLGLTGSSVRDLAIPGVEAGKPITIPVSLTEVAGSFADDLYVTIKGAPAGSTVANGSFDPASNSWTVDGKDLGGHVTIVPPAAYAGTVNLEITGTSVVNADGSTATSAPQTVTFGVSPSGTGAQTLSLAGSPTVTGGTGDDMFHFTPATISAVVADFHPASAPVAEHDVVLVDPSLFATAEAVLNAATETSGGDTLISTAGHSLLLKGVHVAGLTAGDFVIG